ncbi:hypothetical protein [Chitinophaga sp.]|uniref:hypothetical protein n=1 Tax=Chitinophaga sp. TaxID=1869181 RepID=UPI0031DE26CE
MKFFWTLLTGIIIISSCNIDSSPPPATGSGYRDLKGYFQGELNRLETQKPGLFKTVSLNTKHDSVTISAPDSLQLHNMLAPFMDVDLHKPSLQGAYDTILLADQFTGKRSLMYKAKDEATLPQEIILELDSAQQITAVQLNKHVRNLVYEYEQNLEYQHNHHIRITTRQRIAFLPEKELDIKIAMMHL